MASITRSDARANHEKLVAVARELFSVKGLQAEMREIAATAGVGVGTLYRHFASKDDLLIAILQDALDEATVAAEKAEAADDPLVGLRSLLANTISLSNRYNWLFDASIEGRLSPAYIADARAKSESYDLANRYRRLLMRLANTRDTPRLDVDLTAQLLIGATAPWVIAVLLDDSGPDELAARIIRQLVEE